MSFWDLWSIHCSCILPSLLIETERQQQNRCFFLPHCSLPCTYGKCMCGLLNWCFLSLFYHIKRYILLLVTSAMNCTLVVWELRWCCAHHPVKTIISLTTLSLLFRVDYLVWFYKELWIMTGPLQKHDLLRELKIYGEILCIICLSNLCNSHSQFSHSVCVLCHCGRLTAKLELQ